MKGRGGVRLDLQYPSGEGTGEGTIERYYGARTERAIRSRLSRERCHGDRWAEVWIEEPDRSDGTGATVYGKLDKGLDEVTDERAIPASVIHNNPAAMLAAGHKRPASAANGAKGGRPPLVRLHPEDALGLAESAIGSMDWDLCYPVIDASGIVVGVRSADGDDLNAAPMLAGRLPQGAHYEETRQAWIAD